MNDKNLIFISRFLGIIALFIFITIYIAGPLFEYKDQVTGEVEFDEENLSFQCFSFLILDDVKYRDTPPEMEPYIGDKMYVYFPEGIWAYLIGYRTLPIWRVSIEGPQYPKSSYPDGITVLFTLTDIRGKAAEMNIINHFIGMYPMDVGAYTLRQLFPFIYILFVLMIIIYLFYNGPGWWLFGLVPSLMPWYFLVSFAYWLYWFGHNLQDYGAFTLKPFMPTVLGDSKIAQFVTHSYPHVGFYLLVLVFILLLFSILIKSKALKEVS